MVISLADVYGVHLSSKHSNVFYIRALPAISRKKREEKDFKFKCDTDEDAAAWVDVIAHVATGVPLGGTV